MVVVLQMMVMLQMDLRDLKENGLVPVYRAVCVCSTHNGSLTGWNQFVWWSLLKGCNSVLGIVCRLEL